MQFSTIPHRPFVVIATDPLREWRCAQVVVHAISPHEAKVAARAELALDRRDEWSITLVKEVA